MRLGYNASGERVLKRYRNNEDGDSSATLYLHGLSDYPLVEKADYVSSFQETRYIYGIGGLIAYQRGDELAYVFRDHLGSTRVSVRSDGQRGVGYSYDALGNLIDQRSFGVAQSGLAYRYTGQEFDRETGLHNFRARLYDSELFRFYSTDPAGEQHSPYAFVGNSPLMFTDPTGQFIDWGIVAIMALYGGLRSGVDAGQKGGNFFEGFIKGALISGATSIVGQTVSHLITSGLQAAGVFGTQSSLVADVDYFRNGVYIGTVQDPTVWGVQNVLTDAGGVVTKSWFVPDIVATAKAPFEFVRTVQAIGGAAGEVWNRLEGEKSYTTSDGQTVRILTGTVDGVGFSRFNPKSIRDAYNVARKSIASLKKMDFTTKSLAEIQTYIKSKSPLFRELFGVNEKGAQEILNNIENVKIPEGLTKTDLEAYRELINRISDPRGTQEFRAKILDYLIKNR